MHRLILRLSSLGDLILATSVLEVLPGQGLNDWLTSKEYQDLLFGHPRINKVSTFDRKTGLNAWIALCRTIWESDYDEVLDLHLTFRTRIMRLLFWFWSLKEQKKSPNWKSISKERFHLYGYFLFKGLWPLKWHPTPWVNRFTKIVANQDPKGPDFSYLLKKASYPSELRDYFTHYFTTISTNTQVSEGYICVMPSSRWPGKNWPTLRYIEALRKLPYFPIVLGSKTDKRSLELCQGLANSKIPYFNAVGKWSLAETAQVLKGSRGYLGGDTGLAHLAEALNVQSRVIFGPTTPAIGFGPRLPESHAIQSSLWCRPCGKDGRRCYRWINKYACLDQVTANQVVESFSEASAKLKTSRLPGKPGSTSPEHYTKGK